MCSFVLLPSNNYLRSTGVSSSKCHFYSFASWNFYPYFDKIIYYLCIDMLLKFQTLLLLPRHFQKEVPVVPCFLLVISLPYFLCSVLKAGWSTSLSISTHCAILLSGLDLISLCSYILTNAEIKVSGIFILCNILNSVVLFTWLNDSP
jgi:hypothetical protein